MRKPQSVGDFFGPFFRIKVLSKTAPRPGDQEDSGAPLGISSVVKAIKMAGDALKEARDQILIDSRNLQNYAANLSIQMFPGVKLMTLTMTPPREDAQQLIKDEIFKFGQLVEVQWGYSTEQEIKASENHLFVITQPNVKYSNDITFTLTGLDVFSNDSKNRRSVIVLDKDKSKKFTPLEILNSLAKDHLKLKIELRSETLSNPFHPINLPLNTPIPSAMCDWDIFKMLCEQINILFYIGEENKIVLFDKDGISNIPPTYKFTWFRQPQDSYTIPIMTFNTNVIPKLFSSPEKIAIKELKVDNDSDKININSLNTTDGQKQSSQGSKDSKTIGGTGFNKGESIQISNQESIVPFPAISEALDTVAFYAVAAREYSRAKSLWANSQYQWNTTATLTSVGFPDVVPPMNVSIMGVDQKFEGPYYLLEARHTIGTGGYEMSLNLIKTTTSVSDGELPNPTPRPNNPADSSSPTTATENDTPRARRVG